MEGPTDKLKIDALGEANARSLLGHLASDKPGRMVDDFADMPLLKDALHHDRSPSTQGLSTPTSDFPELGMIRNSPIVMQAKGSKSHSATNPIDDHHVEVSTPVVVPSSLHPTSPRKAKSPADSKTPINTPNDGHHVEEYVIVIVPSPSPHTHPRKAKSLGDVKALSLVLQNHFSFLDGLKTTDVVSKFWVDPNEMEEDVSDIEEEIVCTKRKLGRPPKGTGKSKKTTKAVFSTTS